MTPQFRSGQTVRFSNSILRKSTATGDYQIVKQLPDVGDESKSMSRRSDERDTAHAARAATKEMRERDAELAMKEYQDERLAMAEKTARLRAQRLAKEASIDHLRCMVWRQSWA